MRPFTAPVAQAACAVKSPCILALSDAQGTRYRIDLAAVMSVELTAADTPSRMHIEITGGVAPYSSIDLFLAGTGAAARASCALQAMQQGCDSEAGSGFGSYRANDTRYSPLDGAAAAERHRPRGGGMMAYLLLARVGFVDWIVSTIGGSGAMLLPLIGFFAGVPAVTSLTERDYRGVIVVFMAISGLVMIWQQRGLIW